MNTAASAGSESPERGKSPSSRRRWVGLAQIAISAGLLFWLLSRAGLRNVAAQLAQVDPMWYGLAGLVLLASLAVRAVRWYVLLRPLGIDLSVLSLFWLYLVGFFWNSFLPSGFGGDIVKALELRRISRQGAASVISIIAERVEGLFATCLMGLVVILLWPRLVPPQAAWLVAGICMLILAGTWLVRLNLLEWLGEHVSFLRPIILHRRLLEVHNALRAYSWKDLGIGLLASVPFTLLSILDNYLVGLALGIPLGIGYYAIYTPLITIINLLPLSFNGVGVREYTYQVLFGLVNISAEQAIAMALAFNILRFGVGIIGGIASLISGLQRMKAARAGLER